MTDKILSSEFEQYVLKILEGKNKLIDMIYFNKININQEIMQNLGEELTSVLILERMNIKKLKRNRAEISKFFRKFLDDQSKSIQKTFHQSILEFNKETQRILKELDNEFCKGLDVENDNAVERWFTSSLTEMERHGALESDDKVTLSEFCSYLFVPYEKVLVHPADSILLSIVQILTRLSSLRLRWKEITAEKIRKVTLNRSKKLTHFNIELWKETNNVINNGFERIIRESQNDFQRKNNLSNEKIKKIDDFIENPISL